MRLFKKKKKISAKKVAALGLFGFGNLALGAFIQRKLRTNLRRELDEANYLKDSFAMLIHWKRDTIEKHAPWLTASDKDAIEKAEEVYYKKFGTSYPN